MWCARSSNLVCAELEARDGVGCGDITFDDPSTPRLAEPHMWAWVNTWDAGLVVADITADQTAEGKVPPLLCNTIQALAGVGVHYS